MKRILEISDIDLQNPGGGIVRHVKNLCNLFSDNEKIKLDFATWNNLFYNKLLRKTYLDKNELKNKIEKYDYIHIHGFASLIVFQVLVLCKKLHKKVYYSPHFHPFSYLNSPIFGKLFFQICIKPFLNIVNTIFTINDEDTIFFEKYNKQVIKIPHWLDNNMELKSQKKIPNRILFVGKNTIDKGLDFLYTIPTNTYDVHCVTNGVLKRSDFIQHTNISDGELLNLYSTASLLVVPSRYEAFSYVVLEALAQNTPVVISDRVRIGDYLKNCDFVSIFPYGDIKAFHGAIKNTIEKKVDRDYILSIFSLKSAKSNYLNVFLND